jgi:hypothetical protein
MPDDPRAVARLFRGVKAATDEGRKFDAVNIFRDATRASFAVARAAVAAIAEDRLHDAAQAAGLAIPLTFKELDLEPDPPPPLPSPVPRKHRLSPAALIAASRADPDSKELFFQINDHVIDMLKRGELIEARQFYRDACGGTVGDAVEQVGLLEEKRRAGLFPHGYTQAIRDSARDRAATRASTALLLLCAFFLGALAHAQFAGRASDGLLP